MWLLCCVFNCIYQEQCIKFLFNMYHDNTGLLYWNTTLLFIKGLFFNEIFAVSNSTYPMKEYIEFSQNNVFDCPLQSIAIQMWFCPVGLWHPNHKPVQSYPYAQSPFSAVITSDVERWNNLDLYCASARFTQNTEAHERHKRAIFGCLYRPYCN